MSVSTKSYLTLSFDQFQARMGKPVPSETEDQVDAVPAPSTLAAPKPVRAIARVSTLLSAGAGAGAAAQYAAPVYAAPVLPAPSAKKEDLDTWLWRVAPAHWIANIDGERGIIASDRHGAYYRHKYEKWQKISIQEQEAYASKNPELFFRALSTVTTSRGDGDRSKQMSCRTLETQALPCQNKNCKYVHNFVALYVYNVRAFQTWRTKTCSNKTPITRDHMDTCPAAHAGQVLRISTADRIKLELVKS